MTQDNGMDRFPRLNDDIYTGSAAGYFHTGTVQWANYVSDEVGIEVHGLPSAVITVSAHNLEWHDALQAWVLDPSVDVTDVLDSAVSPEPKRIDVPEPSLRGREWIEFATTMLEHIERYTVPQYGDRGEDLASEYTAEDCIKQVNKYLKRFGKNQRPGQQRLDLLKMAHYIQMAHDLTPDE